MGQYFTIRNLTTGGEAVIPHDINYGLQWVSKLDKYSHNDQLRIFEKIIEHNGWDAFDEIVARGDYGTIITYKNGYLEEDYEEHHNDTDEEDMNNTYSAALNGFRTQ